MENLKLAFICVSIIFITLIGSVTWYNIHDRSLMAENINKAVEKGIDPLSVRCSYVKSSDHDIICIAFAAASPQITNVPAAPKK